MTSISVIWLGVREAEAKLTEKAAAVQNATREGVAAAAHTVEAAIKEKAGEGGRHKKGTPTPASQGGGPAVISGTLRRSVSVGRIESWGVLGYQTKVGPTVIYGRRVELEYDYPYTGPGLASSKEAVAAIYTQFWAKAWAG